MNIKVGRVYVSRNKSVWQCVAENDSQSYYSRYKMKLLSKGEQNFIDEGGVAMFPASQDSLLEPFRLVKEVRQ